MFKNNEHETNHKQAETVIGPSVKVKGNFHGDGNIIIEGEVEGNVKTKSALTVSSGAKILADVSAKTAQIGGEIIGNIKIEDYLEILANAKINGDIQCKEISVAKGAEISGHCRMGKIKTDEEKQAKI